MPAPSILRSVLIPVLVAAAAPAVAAAPPLAIGAEAAIPASLLDALRTGGHVIYFRHAATDHDSKDGDRQDLANCTTQRMLSAEGRRQAGAIGAAFARLSIPVGTILASPYCRCLDTARLAFGRVEVHPDLILALDRGAEATRRLTDALARLIADTPAAGTNTVMAGHTVNLLEATGIWPKPEGVAVVFRPDGKGGSVPVASIHPAAWDRTRGTE